MCEGVILKKFRVFETFAGIGAQRKALSNLAKINKINFEVVAIAEWDIYANFAYEAIHYKKRLTKKVNEVFLNEYLLKTDLSKDSKTPLSDSAKLKLPLELKREIYNTNQNIKNIGSVVNMYDRYRDFGLVGNVDLLTYSFPCQDLSNAGNFHGFNKGIQKGTRSGLLLEIEALLKKLYDNKEELPKYLLMENVRSLISDKHLPDFKI